MCEPFEKIFIECMKGKTIIREDKCKKEFENWDTCYKNAYLKEFIVSSSINVYKNKGRWS